MFYFGVGFLRMSNGTTHGHNIKQQKPGRHQHSPDSNKAGHANATTTDDDVASDAPVEDTHGIRKASKAKTSGHNSQEFGLQC